MARQAMRFNYFVPKISFENNHDLDIWNMSEFLDYMINNHESFNPAVILGDEISDFEWNDAEFDQAHNLYRFTLSKLRSKNIPAKKRINAPKNDIVLSDDEFLGEFILLVFDPSIRVLIVQSNFYGLTTKQTALALSGMRQKWLAKIGEPEESMGIISLDPIVDISAIERARNNQIYRSFKVRGSNVSVLADHEFNSDVMDAAVKSTDRLKGHNFEISISMGTGPRNESLNNDDVKKVLDDVEYLKGQNTDISMHISTKQDEDHAVELIDIIQPRYTTKFNLEVKNRTTLGSEYIYNNFLTENYYNEEVYAQNTLRQILGR